RHGSTSTAAATCFTRAERDRRPRSSATTGRTAAVRRPLSTLRFARGLLAAPLRGAGRVGDLRSPLLRHAFLLEAFVLLLVLDARSLAGHWTSFRLDEVLPRRQKPYAPLPS